MKKFELMSALVLMASVFAPLSDAFADRGKLGMAFRYPKDPVTEAVARDLVASALSKRNVEVAVCARAYDNNHRGKQDCETNAELNYRLHLTGVPGLKFGMFFQSGYTDKVSYVMDLRGDEILNRKLDLFLEPAGPVTENASFFGIVLDTNTCQFRTFYNDKPVDVDQRFQRLACEIVRRSGSVTKTLWERTYESSSDQSQDVNDISFLLAHGADANIVNDNQEISILSLAASKGLVGEMKLLMAFGARITSRDKDGCTALCHAALKGQYEAAKLLIESGASVHTKDNGGEAPLGWAAGSGSLETVKLLVQAGAEVNAKQETFRQWSALMIAASTGANDIVEYLVSQGADVNYRSRISGQTALSLAQVHGFTETVELLKRLGARQ